MKIAMQRELLGVEDLVGVLYRGVKEGAGVNEQAGLPEGDRRNSR